ncbi:hypothetical protein [Tibeticola sp.]|jgi:hypothetical protein|uniref:hypothetical protein n=1 Tax=Tibeticola sp. TaxID=2005368 RepID=UPI0025DE0187|nr:hypothetical protein [Tibeticola sp.]
MKSADNDEPCGLPEIIGCGVVAVIAFSISLAAIGGWSLLRWLSESSAAAAWVQAVGSILAIFAAMEVGRRQIAAHWNLENKRQSEKERKFLIIIGSLLRSMQNALNDIEKELDNHPGGPVSSYHLDRIKSASDALLKIDLFECPLVIVDPLLKLFPVPCQDPLAIIQLFNKSFYSAGGRPEQLLPSVKNAITVQRLTLDHALEKCR